MTSTKVETPWWENMSDEEFEEWEKQYWEGAKRPGKPKLSNKPDRLYFAYGSNLHVPQMKYRCPDALQAEPGVITAWRLIFRGVADIEPTDSHLDRVEGGFWWVSEADEAALDRYEGVNHTKPEHGMYSRVHFPVLLPGRREPVQCLTYLMNSKDIQPPSAGYFKTIADGYSHWGLDGSQLLASLEQSQSNWTNLKNHRRASKWKHGKLSKPVSTKVGRRLLDQIRRGKILVFSE